MLPHHLRLHSLKLASSTVLLVTIARLILAIITSPSPLADQRTYSLILQVVALSVLAPLTDLNHNLTRRSSTILLFFYPLFFLTSATSIRTASYFLDRNQRLVVADFSLSIAEIAFITAAWMLECVGPEVDEVVDGFVPVGKAVKESPFETANIYSRYASSYPCLPLNMY